MKWWLWQMYQNSLFKYHFKNYSTFQKYISWRQVYDEVAHHFETTQHFIQRVFFQKVYVEGRRVRKYNLQENSKGNQTLVSTCIYSRAFWILATIVKGSVGLRHRPKSMCLEKPLQSNIVRTEYVLPKLWDRHVLKSFTLQKMP